MPISVDLLAQKLASHFMADHEIDYTSFFLYLKEVVSSGLADKVISQAFSLIPEGRSSAFVDVIHFFCQVGSCPSGSAEARASILWIPVVGQKRHIHDFCITRYKYSDRFKLIFESSGIIRDCSFFDFCSGLAFPANGNLLHGVAHLRDVLDVAALLPVGHSKASVEGSMSVYLERAGCFAAMNVSENIIAACLPFYSVNRHRSDSQDLMSNQLHGVDDWAGSLDGVRAALVDVVPGVRFGAPGLLPRACREARSMADDRPRFSVVR